MSVDMAWLAPASRRTIRIGRACDSHRHSQCLLAIATDVQGLLTEPWRCDTHQPTVRPCGAAAVPIAMRFIHFLGLALLLGGASAAATIAVLPAQPDALLALRQSVDAITWSITMPGLVLAAISGCCLLFMRSGTVQQRWLLLHLGAAIMLMLVIVLSLLPVSRELSATAAGVFQGAPLPDNLPALVDRERIVLWLTACLALGTAALGFFKPRLKPPS